MKDKITYEMHIHYKIITESELIYNVNIILN